MDAQYGAGSGKRGRVPGAESAGFPVGCEACPGGVGWPAFGLSPGRGPVRTGLGRGAVRTGLGREPVRTRRDASPSGPGGNVEPPDRAGTRTRPDPAGTRAVRPGRDVEPTGPGWDAARPDPAGREPVRIGVGPAACGAVAALRSGLGRKVIGRGLGRGASRKGT